MNKRIVVISGFSGAGERYIGKTVAGTQSKGTSGFEIVAFCI